EADSSADLVALLDDVEPRHRRLAARRLDDRGEHSKHGRLACAVHSQQPKHMARPGFDGNAIHGTHNAFLGVHKVLLKFLGTDHPGRSVTAFLPSLWARSPAIRLNCRTMRKRRARTFAKYKHKNALGP